MIRKLGAVLLLAGVAAGQTTTLESEPMSPPQGLLGTVELNRGTAPTKHPSLAFAWQSNQALRTTLQGRRVAKGSWLFVESRADRLALDPARVGLVASMLTEPQNSPSLPPRKLGEVKPSLLNLREGPSTKYPIGRRAKQDEELVIVGKQGAWLELDDNGRTLWAHGNYVRASGGFAPGRRSISLRQSSETYYQVVVREGREVVARQRLRDTSPTVLLVSVEDDQGFPTSLRGLRTWYAEQGYRVKYVIEGDSAGLIKLFEKAATKGTPYSRVVISTHSGWDGPMWDDGQVEVHEDDFVPLAAAFAKGTTPDAKIYVSGCHAAGSNKYESANTKIWVRDLARVSNRIVAGPTGSTSAAQHTERQTLAALEGVGTVIQETVLATPTTVTRWGGGAQRSTVPNEAQAPPPASTYSPINMDSLFRHSITVVAPMPELAYEPSPIDIELDPAEINLEIDDLDLDMDLEIEPPVIDLHPMR